MVNVLSKFESFMSSLVEGGFSSVFRKKLPLLELKSKLESHMEDNLFLKGEGRREAHTFYQVTLSQKDYTDLTAYRALLTDLQRYLIDIALERGYKLARKPIIRLLPDPNLTVGKVHIESQLNPPADQGQQPGLPQAGGGGGEEPMHTVTINVSEGFKQAYLEAQQAQARAAAPRQGSPFPYAPAQAPGPGYGQPYPSQAGPSYAPPVGPYAPGAPSVQQPVAPPAPGLPEAELRLHSQHGQPIAEKRYRLDREVIQIGRHVSNDVVVNDRRVSRHHAQVRYEQGRFVIYDLGSLNGIDINGRSVRQHTLRSGDQVKVGSYEYEFRQRR